MVEIGQFRYRRHVISQGREQHSGAPAGADVAHETSVHTSWTFELPGAGLLRIAGPEIVPAFALVTAQEAACGVPALGAVAADDEVNAAMGQRLHQPGCRVAPIQDQQIAPAQPNRWTTTVRNWHPINEVHLNPNTPKSTEQKNLRKAA
jgi:hypothetical protein